jgi:hypothetical protein
LVFIGKINQHTYECSIEEDVESDNQNTKFSTNTDNDVYNEELVINENENNKNSFNQAIYDIRYLAIITKASSLNQYLTLCIQNGMPLVVKYNINDIGKIIFILTE